MINRKYDSDDICISVIRIIFMNEKKKIEMNKFFVHARLNQKRETFKNENNYSRKLVFTLYYLKYDRRMQKLA